MAIGCTISPILFALIMRVIPRAAEGGASPADFRGGCYMPPLKTFTDDTTILCSKENKTRRKYVVTFFKLLLVSAAGVTPKHSVILFPTLSLQKFTSPSPPTSLVTTVSFPAPINIIVVMSS
ncbi:reverse transcriptase [Plakobranchus ocellatus]|uniref:Reverse transcriptase n=1 Tax=Plakobranchus ocellatus TaxID=259542 RepID=A0AAV4B2Z3_9GAST|nr:reverse transcriptase [Plakobranchus ocellatus]